MKCGFYGWIDGILFCDCSVYKIINGVYYCWVDDIQFVCQDVVVFFDNIDDFDE